MTFSAKKRFDRAVDGILLLDKPQGLSSNAALQRARAAYRALKAGHAGSLDPLATGMLPICFGQATKICGWLLDSRKTYRVAAKLGVRTDSADAEGYVVAAAAIPALTADLLTRTLQRFLGEQQQVPPMFSALKRDGQRLYELARRGETVDREPRRIFIEHIELLSHGQDSVEFQVRCSKGTYIRSLVEDVAQALGTLGHVTALRRVEVEPFGFGPMASLDELADSGLDALDARLLPSDAALAALPEIRLDLPASIALSHGRAVLSPQADLGGTTVRIYHAEGRFLGIADMEPGGVLRPRRLFV